MLASCNTAASSIASSTIMSSTTLAPPKCRNTTQVRHQSSSASSRASMKRKPQKEVVLHHPTTSPPAEDWVLFPDEVITTKNSSVQSSRCRDPREHAQPRHPRRPSTRLERSEENREKDSRVTQDMEYLKRTLSASRLDYAHVSSRASERCEAKPPSLAKFPERLPTPDLSDIEEDYYWSCCGSSESSA